MCENDPLIGDCIERAVSHAWSPIWAWFLDLSFIEQVVAVNIAILPALLIVVVLVGLAKFAVYTVLFLGEWLPKSQLAKNWVTENRKIDEENARIRKELGYE